MGSFQKRRLTLPVKTVLTFLIIFTTGLQYVIQRINYKSDLARIQQFVSKARLAAWGAKLSRIEGKRKVPLRRFDD
jgi:DnaJ homolog subfamily C member 1